MIKKALFRARIERIAIGEREGAPPAAIVELVAKLATVEGATMRLRDDWSEDARRLLKAAGYDRIAAARPSSFRVR